MNVIESCIISKKQIVLAICMALLPGISYSKNADYHSRTITNYDDYENNQGLKIYDEDFEICANSIKVKTKAHSGILIKNEDRSPSTKFTLKSDKDISVSGSSFGLNLHGNVIGTIISENGNISFESDELHGANIVGDRFVDGSHYNIVAKKGELNFSGPTCGLEVIYRTKATFNSNIFRASQTKKNESADLDDPIDIALPLYGSISSYHYADTEVTSNELYLNSVGTYSALANLGARLTIFTNNAFITGPVGALDGGEVEINVLNGGYINKTFRNEAIISSTDLSGYGNSRVVINAKGTQINGDILSQYGGFIDLNLDSGSSITGSTIIEERKHTNSDKIFITLNNNSSWIIKGDSILTNLTIDNSTVDLTGSSVKKSAGVINNKGSTLETKTLLSKNSILKMRANVSATTDNKNEKTFDRVIVTEKASGNLLADIDININDKTILYSDFLLSQGADSDLIIHNFKGKNEFSSNGMVTVWALSFVPEGNEISIDTVKNYASNNHGKGAGKWYLIYADREIDSIYPSTTPDQGGDSNTDTPPDNNAEPNLPSKPPVVEDPAEMQQILDLGVSTMQALSFASELDDLRTRTGEVRHGLDDGAWARASYQKDRIFGENSRTFKQETQDLHIGLDHLIPTSNDSAWLLGGALRYAKSDQKGVGQFTNEGDLQQYSAKLYATYLHDAGSYADFVIQAGRYDQELQGVANDGYSKFSADYKTYGYGLSAEFGHQFALGNGIKSLFIPFIEPQMQLSYFMAKGKDFTTSTGMKISQGDADFLTGRIGVVLGNTVKYGEGANPNFFQIAFTGGMKYEFMGNQIVRFTGVEGLSKTRRADDIGGARFYYGFTSDWKLTDSLRAFAKLEREEGHHYTKDYDASIGVRYAF